MDMINGHCECFKMATIFHNNRHLNVSIQVKRKKRRHLSFVKHQYYGILAGYDIIIFLNSVH